MESKNLFDEKKYDLRSERGRAKLEVDKFNNSHPVGSKVLYLKSGLEGYQITIVTKPAYIQGDATPMVILEGIGTALISKIEPFYE
jgi:hypothetical protein